MIAALIMIVIASLLSACLGISQEVTPPTPEPGAETPVGLPNPASVHCEQQGGRLEIRTAADGGQVGVCVFADGSECEEWAFYRGECAPGQPPAAGPVGLPNPASVHCEQQGGRLEIRTAADSGQVGVCVFADGSECEEWAFYRGECAPGQPAATPTSESDAVLAEILATVQLPADAFSEGPAVLPLNAPAGSPPLWALYSTGMRNYEVDPLPSHFVAIFTKDDAGWRELARLDLDQMPAADTQLIEPLPDFIAPDGVQQVAIEPSRVWLTVDGGVGAHSGTFQVLSFDGQALKLELASSSASPGAGFIAEVNQDGQNDVVLDLTEPYIFCYACGVRYPAYRVYTWLGDALAEIELSALMMGQRGTQADQLNSEAMALVQAGLWADALAKIDEAVAAAGDDDPPTPAGSLRWNQALIKLQHDALAQAIQDSAYPLLNRVFYGDYAGAVDMMRGYTLAEIFSVESPLIVGTAAEGWEDALSGHIIQSATAAVAVRPDLAPAYFLRGWAEFLADPGSARARADLRRAAETAPDDPLLVAAAQFNPAPEPTPAAAPTPAPIRIQFAPGATAAVVGGILQQNGVQTYVLRAMAGQTMEVVASAPRGGLLLGVSGADGQVLKSSDAGDSTWSGVLPATQDYFITLSTAGAGTSYTLRVTIPPLAR